VKRISTLLFFIAVFFSTQAQAARWQVLLYMDSSDEMSDMAIKNITDLLRAKIDDTVEFLIQLHAYDTVALRYTVSSQGLTFVQEHQLRDSARTNLEEAAHWAFADSAADYRMLIFWNHGWGILDPRWNASASEWQVNALQESDACPIKRSIALEEHKRHRGYMFSTTPRTYLSNQDMIQALSHIKKNILGDKKIDVIAFDTCMGGMLEVAYQLESYASYLVGIQVCSLMDGFDYTGLLTALKNRPTPSALVQDLIHILDEYYQIHDANGVYAYTALDLSLISSLVDALNTVARTLLKMDDGIPFALEAHNTTPRFCTFTMYTDLISYIKQVEVQARAHSTTAHMHELLSAIELLYQAMEQCLVARCAGYANYDKTHGCAIYAPMYAVDESYYATPFAQASQWLDLLEAVAKRALP